MRSFVTDKYTFNNLIWYTITKLFTYFKTIFCDNDNSEQLNENYICKGKALKTISLMCTGKKRMVKKRFQLRAAPCLLVMGTLLTVRSDITNSPASWQQQNKLTLHFQTSVMWKIHLVNSIYYKFMIHQ